MVSNAHTESLFDMKKAPPKVEPHDPRLSETLRPFRSRKVCQKCGHADPSPLYPLKVSAWIEHDHKDRPQAIYVFLCEACSKEIIEPHIRLYRQAQQFEPLPGIMDLCADCRWREGSRCTNPVAAFNGGAEPGLKIDINGASRAHINYGGGKGEWLWMFTEPATGCSGKEAK